MAASAYPPGTLARVWSETAAAAVRAARAATAAAVATQGHVLRPVDFTAPRRGAAVHYLDLTVNLPSAPAPDPPSLGLVRRVLDGLARTPLPRQLDDASAAVKGTGRVPLTDADRALLGPLAERVPLLRYPAGPAAGPGRRDPQGGAGTAGDRGGPGGPESTAGRLTGLMCEVINWGDFEELRVPGDASLIGSIGVLAIATRGQAGPGEVLLKIRGGTEAYIAWSAEPIGPGPHRARHRVARPPHGQR